MGTRFSFQAEDITANIVSSNSGPGATLVVTTPPAPDPVSEAVNNVRFAFNGFGSEGHFAGITIRTRAVFKLQVPQPSRITVFGHLTPHGVSTVTGQPGLPLVLVGFNTAGVAAFRLSAQMRVRVVSDNGQVVFTQFFPVQNLVSRTVEGGLQQTATFTDVTAVGLLEKFLTVTAPQFVVLPTDRIFVRIQYDIDARGFDDGAFIADFAQGIGAGLNVPMVVLNF